MISDEYRDLKELAEAMTYGQWYIKKLDEPEHKLFRHIYVAGFNTSIKE